MLKAVKTLFKGIVVAFMAAYLALASAQPMMPPNAAEYHAQRVELMRLYVATVQCMHTATIASLNAGISNADDISAFSIRMCGRGLYFFLTTTSGWTSKDAARLITKMAERELRTIAK